MKILKNNWDSQLEYMVSLLNISCNINIYIIKNIYLMLLFKVKNTNFLINSEIFSSPFTLMFEIKIKKKSKISM